MAHFAVLDALTKEVKNIIVCDNKPLAELLTGGICVEYDNDSLGSCGVGWIYNGETFEQSVLVAFIQKIEETKTIDAPKK